jgi:hypothetical protein
MNKEVTSEHKVGNYIIEVFPQMNPESPRDWDNFGTMVCFHRRYNLGDKHNYNGSNYGGWEEQRKDIEKNENVCVILPLYLYDHSGITIKTSPFGCSWDSGQVGWIFISKDKVKKEFNLKRISKEVKERAEKILESEVLTYDQYLTGDIYGYEISKVTECELGHEHKESLESCWGFYGEDNCMDEAKSVLSYYTEKEKELV